MARVIQEYIKKPLADEVLFGKLVQGGTVRILVEPTEDGEGKLVFQFLSRDEEKALPRPEERKALPRRANGAAKPRKSSKREAKAE